MNHLPITLGGNFIKLNLNISLYIYLNMNDFNNDIIKYELINSTENIIEEYVNNNIKDYHKYNFLDTLYSYVFANLKIQIGHLYDYDISAELEKLINKCLNIYHQRICPKRQYTDISPKNPPNIDKISKKIDYILSKPQPEQKTDDWYNFRYNLITASNAFKAIGTDAKINELIVEKCKPIDLIPKSNGPSSTETAFHHGIKYEPLSVLYYEYKYNTIITDFGCIQHDTYDCLGASPDGIVTDKNSNLYGRMLEIKNPISREITGIPKEEYWIQMQLQMEVCDLNYCDFLETKFIQYDNEEDFNNDGSFNLTNDDKHKGIILHFIKNNQHHYEYPPFNCNKEEFELWEEKLMSDSTDMNWVENIYWKLDIISCVLVLRNKPWFNAIIEYITDIWEIVKTERISGKWTERLPKTKIKQAKLPFKKEKKSECMIIEVDI